MAKRVEGSAPVKDRIHWQQVAAATIGRLDRGAAAAGRPRRVAARRIPHAPLRPTPATASLRCAALPRLATAALPRVGFVADGRPAGVRPGVGRRDDDRAAVRRGGGGAGGARRAGHAARPHAGRRPAGGVRAGHRAARALAHGRHGRAAALLLRRLLHDAGVPRVPARPRQARRGAAGGRLAAAGPRLCRAGARADRDAAAEAAAAAPPGRAGSALGAGAAQRPGAHREEAHGARLHLGLLAHGLPAAQWHRRHTLLHRRHIPGSRDVHLPAAVDGDNGCHPIRGDRILVGAGGERGSSPADDQLRAADDVLALDAGGAPGLAMAAARGRLAAARGHQPLPHRLRRGAGPAVVAADRRAAAARRQALGRRRRHLRQLARVRPHDRLLRRVRPPLRHVGRLLGPGLHLRRLHSLRHGAAPGDARPHGPPDTVPPVEAGRHLLLHKFRQLRQRARDRPDVRTCLAAGGFLSHQD